MKYLTKKRELYYDDVIRLYYDEKLRISSIIRIIPVSKNTISNWIRIFAVENRLSKESIMKKRSIGEAKPKASTPEEISELRKQLAEVRKELKNKERSFKEREKTLREKDRELRRQTMRADFYDEMINVAENMFKIDIRKKTGTKQ